MLTSKFSRRTFLKALAAAPGVAAVAPHVGSASPAPAIQLVARKQRVPLVGRGYPDTEIWGYDGRVPGPEIRVRRGEPVRVIVTNRLDQPTTVHWHGLRIGNAMDGVPGLTQPAVEPGDSFRYEFTPPDAGTFWYHSHVNSSEQVGRGLYGALIVEEEHPPAVDRDVVWVLDDWLLNRQAEIVDAFDHPRDASHAGQIGNTATVNGRIVDQYAVTGHERIRLRLINAANARIFRLRFEGHHPAVISLDGQPVSPHPLPQNTLVLGPAMRADLILDCIGRPGQRFAVIDQAYRQPYKLLDLVYEPVPPLRPAVPGAAPQLAGNALSEPDLSDAERLEVKFGGGVHGGLQGAEYQGRWLDLRSLFQAGKMWAVNGIVGGGRPEVPLFQLTAGRTYVLDLVNNSRWPHPIHLHGHHFRVLSRNGTDVALRPWLDTILLEADERAEVAFVADNPGSWMFHCHIPEHMAAGMTTIVRVAR